MPRQQTLQWIGCTAAGIIDARQLSAVRRLQNRWERHKDRYEADMAVMGPGLSDIVWRVVIRGDGLRDAETALGWPMRAGKLVLVMALNRLADHYASVGRNPEGQDRADGLGRNDEHAVLRQQQTPEHRSSHHPRDPDNG